jgi:G3E family GTPase
LSGDDTRVPVTVLTGFLGSGKTTLLNRILTEEHGRRIAVIENEFGEIGIDQALVINADEEVFEMNNGCICCTVRGDLIRILGNLLKRRDRFDRIIVETTGMADPGPVAQTFFVDEDVQGRFRLDGIVTLVDAKHLSLHLDDSKECKEQIAFADVLVLNKCDLATAAELDAVESRIRSINGVARVLRTTQAAAPIDAVLDVGGFDLARALAEKPAFLDPEYPFEWGGCFDLAVGDHTLVCQDGPDPTMTVMALPVAASSGEALPAVAEVAVRTWTRDAPTRRPGEVVTTGGCASLDLRAIGESVFTLRVETPGRHALLTQHLPSEFALTLRSPDGAALSPGEVRAWAAGHTHDDTVSSVGIHAEGTVDAERFNAWLSGLLRAQGTNIFRSKGILNVTGCAGRFVFQGVHMLVDAREDRPWGDTAPTNDLVFIGRELDRAALTEGFRSCLL